MPIEVRNGRRYGRRPIRRAPGRGRVRLRKTCRLIEGRDRDRRHRNLVPHRRTPRAEPETTHHPAILVVHTGFGNTEAHRPIHGGVAADWWSRWVKKKYPPWRFIKPRGLEPRDSQEEKRARLCVLRALCGFFLWFLCLFTARKSGTTKDTMDTKDGNKRDGNKWDGNKGDGSHFC